MQAAGGQDAIQRISGLGSRPPDVERAPVQENHARDPGACAKRRVSMPAQDIADWHDACIHHGKAGDFRKNDALEAAYFRRQPGLVEP